MCVLWRYPVTLAIFTGLDRENAYGVPRIAYNEFITQILKKKRIKKVTKKSITGTQTQYLHIQYSKMCGYYASGGAFEGGLEKLKIKKKNAKAGMKIKIEVLRINCALAFGPRV